MFESFELLQNIRLAAQIEHVLYGYMFKICWINECYIVIVFMFQIPIITVIIVCLCFPSQLTHDTCKVHFGNCSSPNNIQRVVNSTAEFVL